MTATSFAGMVIAMAESFLSVTEVAEGLTVQPSNSILRPGSSATTIICDPAAYCPEPLPLRTVKVYKVSLPDPVLPPFPPGVGDGLELPDVPGLGLGLGLPDVPGFGLPLGFVLPLLLDVYCATTVISSVTLTG